MTRMMRIIAAALCVAITATLTAKADLPEGYTQLPYLYLNGNCQVRTDYTLAVTDKIVMTWCTKSVSGGNECLWCTRSSSTAGMLTMFMFKTNIAIYYNNVGYEVGKDNANFTVNTKTALEALTKYTIIADYNARTCVITNEFTGAETLNCSWTVSNDFTAGSKLGLFASHHSGIDRNVGNCGHYFVYSFKVYDAAGTLKLDLVPVKNPSGTVGLYDTVGGSFLVDSTSGTLDDTLIDKTFSSGFRLLSDEVFGTVTINSGKSLNINGHKLTISGMAGSGSIDDYLLDLTYTDSSRVTSTTTFYGGTAANLFNNNYARDNTDNTKRILVAKANLPLVVDYDMYIPQVVNMYKVYCGPIPGYHNRNPKEWEFYGSNDGTNWTRLHSQSGITWNGAQTTREYSFENATAYRYYRFKGISSNDNDYFEMVQLEYFNTTCGELHLNVPAGKTVNNSTVELGTGGVKFKLVKEGEGAYVAAKSGQAYTNGTEVLAGTIGVSSSGLSNPFGTGAVNVYTTADGTFDEGFDMQDGSTLDLTGREDAFDANGCTFADGANVTIDVTGRTLAVGTRVIAWDEKPENVANVTFSFASDDTEVVVGDTGLFYGYVPTLAELAWWTGAANDGNPTNPANWNCVDTKGNVIENGLPSDPTTIYFDGNISVQTPDGYSLTPYACIVSNCTLTADCDMRGFGTLTIADGCTVNVGSHKLHVQNVTGSGTITDSYVDLTEPDTDGTHVTSDPSTFTDFAGYTAKALFNNNFVQANDSNHRLIIKCEQLPLKVDYDFGNGNPQTVNAYAIHFASQSSANRAPKSWNFYGSNDGETWTTLDERSLEISWTSGEHRIYRFTNTTAYRYYRIEFIAPNSSDSGVYLELVQLEYFTAKDGELHLHVPADTTFENSTVSFEGTLKIVKEGEGTFVAAKARQNYAGGTEVVAGTLTTVAGSGTTGNWSANHRAFGGCGTSITVRSGATFDIKANYDFYRYNIVLDGGTLANSAADMTRTDWDGSNCRSLTADSTLDVARSVVFGSNIVYGYGDTDLGGNTLTVNIAIAKYLYLRSSSITNGAVYITSGGYLYPTVECDARTVDFKVGCALNMGAALSVRNYEAVFDSNYNGGTAALNVYGSFIPSSHNYFYGCTMQDGSTIDLSKRTLALPLVSDFTGGDKTLKFAEGATVTITVGDRSVARGTRLLEWSEIPTGVTFQFDAETTAAGITPTLMETGLFYGGSATDALYAWWTGAAGDNNPLTPGNWSCVNLNGDAIENGLPSSATTVYFEGNLNIQPPEGYTLAPYGCEVSNCTLQADCDMRAFGTLKIADGCTLCMNGHNLYVTALTGGGTISAPSSDLTDTDSTRVSSDTTFAVSTVAANLFNNNYSRDMTVVDGVATGRVIVAKADLPLVVDYDFGEGTEQVVDAYKVCIGNADSYTYRSPGNWTFQGSNDKENWTTLDERTDQVDWLGRTATEHRVYKFDNATAYRYYRINITSGRTADADYMEFVQLEYLHVAPAYAELHIDCDDDVELAETYVEGNVKIVKEGVGALTMARTRQLFFGGVDIAEGSVKVKYSGNDLPMGLKPESIRVEAGGVLDMNGHADFACSVVTLNGGTVVNGGQDLGSGYNLIGNVVLESDATFAFTNSYGITHYGSVAPIVELGGNTLSVQIQPNKTFTLRNAIVENGTVDVTGGGIMSLCGTSVVATNVDFVLDCALDVQVPFSVRNYEAKYAADANSGTAALNVYGTFKPASHNYFYGCTLQDGSAIDLSNRSDALPLASSFTSGDNTLKFAEGATVSLVGVGGSSPAGRKIISWDAKPENVTFTSSEGLNIKSKSDGLYVYSGFILIFR